MHAVRASAPERPAASPGQRAAAPGLLIVALTLLAYLPAMRAGFVWDDPDYVTQNELLRSLGGLARIWLPGSTYQYYPMVFTSFWIEYHLWGLYPLGYHLSNILLHAGSAVLVWRLLLRLKIPAAWVCALVFALHPVHVESVAWVTERKNVLSGLFYLLSMCCYLRFARYRTRGWYFGAMAWFVVALLSKTVTCTLPVALLLMGWYRRGAWSRKEVFNLVPFFIVGAALGLLTVWLERHHVGAQGVDWELTIGQRTLIAGQALWFYATTLLWPTKLIFIYPRWAPDPSRFVEWLAPLAVLLVLAALWLGRVRMGRGPLTAVLFFILTLAPALGFVDVFPFRYSFVADHFQYLASLGFIALVVGGLGGMFARSARGRWTNAGRLAAVVTLVVFGALTWNQCRIYQNAETLYRHTLSRNPAAWMAHYNLGLILDRWGEAEAAREHYQETVRLRPQHHKAHTELARHCMTANDLEGAVRHYRAALAADPRLLTANINLGNIYASRGQYETAIGHYRAALATRSPLPEADFALGNALMAGGDFAGAVEHYRRALAGGPDDAPTRANLGLALLRLGQADAAVGEFEAALRLQPELTETRLLLARALSRHEDYAAAAETLRQGLRLSPHEGEIIGLLAWILSTCPDGAVRDGVEAVRLAEQLVEMTGRRDAGALGMLAAAYAEAGDFGRALQTARQARALAANDAQLLQQIDAELEVFEKRQPYRSVSFEPRRAFPSR